MKKRKKLKKLLKKRSKKRSFKKRKKIKRNKSNRKTRTNKINKKRKKLKLKELKLKKTKFNFSKLFFKIKTPSFSGILSFLSRPVFEAYYNFQRDRKQKLIKAQEAKEKEQERAKRERLELVKKMKEEQLKEEVYYSKELKKDMKIFLREQERETRKQKAKQQQEIINNLKLSKQIEAFEARQNKEIAELEKTAFNVNFPTNPRMQYPDCIKITPVGRRYASNFALNVHLKSQNLFTAQIDSITKNSSLTLKDDYSNCLDGYITVSPISMHLLKEKNFEELKKVQF